MARTRRDRGSSAASDVVEVHAPARIDLAGGTLDIFPISQLEAKQRVVCADRVALAAETTLPLHREIALHIGPAQGAEITTRSGVPSGSGLGGSSTLVVAMLLAAAKAAGRPLGRTRVLRIATDLEARVIGVPTGAQDHVGALYGGLSAITYPPGGTHRAAIRTDVAALAGRLVLVYTGHPHDSAVNNWTVTRRYIERSVTVRRHIAAIAEAARELLAALRAGDLDAAGRAMQVEWEARKRLAPGVTTATIERLTAAAQAAGAIGTKVCGAGGGGCVVLWCGAGRRAAVTRAARATGGRVLSFRPALVGAAFA